MRCRIKCQYIEIEKFALSDRYSYILWVMCVQSLQVNQETIPCEGVYQSASLTIRVFHHLRNPIVAYRLQNRLPWDTSLTQNHHARARAHTHTHTHTQVYYLLHTPWSRVLLEKLTGFKLVRKFPIFYGNRRFITAFTSTRHLSHSWARSIQSMPPHPTSWRFILILSSHLRLGLPSGLFPSGFPTRTMYTPLFPVYALRDPPISFLSILSPKQNWVRRIS